MRRAYRAYRAYIMMKLIKLILIPVWLPIILIIMVIRFFIFAFKEKRETNFSKYTFSNSLNLIDPVVNGYLLLIVLSFLIWGSTFCFEYSASTAGLVFNSVKSFGSVIDITKKCEISKANGKSGRFGIPKFEKVLSDCVILSIYEPKIGELEIVKNESMGTIKKGSTIDLYYTNFPVNVVYLRFNGEADLSKKLIYSSLTALSGFLFLFFALKFCVVNFLEIFQVKNIKFTYVSIGIVFIVTAIFGLWPSGNQFIQF